MKPNKSVKLLAAGIVFLIGSLVPLKDGDAVNTTLLVLAIVFLLLAAKFATKTVGATESKPPAA